MWLVSSHIILLNSKFGFIWVSSWINLIKVCLLLCYYCSLPNAQQRNTAEVDLVSWKVGRELVRGGQVRDLERELVQSGPDSRGSIGGESVLGVPYKTEHFVNAQHGIWGEVKIYYKLFYNSSQFIIVLSRESIKQDTLLLPITLLNHARNKTC